MTRFLLAAALPLAAVAPAAAQTVLPPADLSVAGMVANADWVVRSVLAGLAFASVLTWTVALVKAVEILVARRRAHAAVTLLRQAVTLEEAWQRLGPAPGPCTAMLRAARAELAASTGTASRDGVKERAGWHLERLVAAAGRALGRGTGVLATIAATAPFVGLFGTVWGIMNSFIGIARTQTTNLAVVAPGIAEALLATAVGLVAAIPAVVIYNLFARAIAGVRAEVNDGVAAVMALLSRDLDRVAPARLRAVGE